MTSEEQKWLEFPALFALAPSDQDTMFWLTSQNAVLLGRSDHNEQRPELTSQRFWRKSIFLTRVQVPMSGYSQEIGIKEFHGVIWSGIGVESPHLFMEKQLISPGSKAILCAWKNYPFGLVYKACTAHVDHQPTTLIAAQFKNIPVFCRDGP